MWTDTDFILKHTKDIQLEKLIKRQEVNTITHLLLFPGPAWSPAATDPSLPKLRISQGHPYIPNSWVNDINCNTGNTSPVISQSASYSRTSMTRTPYICLLCGKRFLFKDHFEGHMNVHNNLKSFACPRCSRKYAYKTSLRLHMKRCFKLGKHGMDH